MAAASGGEGCELVRPEEIEVPGTNICRRLENPCKPLHVIVVVPAKEHGGMEEKERCGERFLS